MKNKRIHKTEILLNSEIEKLPVPIASDAMITSRDIADGRVLPVLIIDTSSRPDIEDMIKIHKQIRGGNVKSIWAKNSKNNYIVNLILSFQQPSKCVVILEFDVVKYGGVIDQIINSQGFYLQYGRKGDRLINKFDLEKTIIVEVPSIHFFKEWNKILRKSLIKEAKIKFKLNRSEAKKRTENIIAEWREAFSNRKK